MSELFKKHTLEQNTQALANHMPSGKAFESKNVDESTFRKLLEIFAPEIERFEDVMLEISEEHDINEANVFLPRWESAVGIPDDCFPATGTLEDRRLHVIVKLACMNVATDEDFINLAAKLGKTVTITVLSENAFPPYDIPMIPTILPAARFIWLVSGANLEGSFPPYDIPHSLDIGDLIIQCVFEKLKPSYVKIVFVNN